MRKYIPFVIVIAVIAIIVGVGVAARNDDKTVSPSPTPPRSSSSSSEDSMSNMPSPSPSPSSESSTSSKVSISNFSFSPADITVKKGTTVTWTNQDSVEHTVTADSGSGPNSELIGNSKTYSYTFDTVGTFSYHCKPHPQMKGKVIVTE